MRPGAVKVETLGSYWWFDEQAKEYLRLPKTEKPRKYAHWSDERAGRLQDAVWHTYSRFELVQTGFPSFGGQVRLYIYTPDGEDRPIRAPQAKRLGTVA